MTDAGRPLGLSLLAWLLGFWAGAALLLVLGLAFGDGPIMLGGRALPRDQALAHLLPVLVPMVLAAAGAALALGLDRHWARAAALLPFALAAVAPVFTGTVDTLGELAMAALAIVPMVALVAWYLYFRPGVVAWFRGLRAEQTGIDPAPGGAGSRAE